MISNLLSSKGFIVTNKTIAKGIGLYESVILAELCSEYQYHLENDKLTDDGYFYCTATTLENETTLSVKEQAKPIKNLIKIGFIKSKLKGVPAKRHFKIDEDCGFNILQFIQKGKTQFSQKGETVLAKKAKQDALKRQTNKNIDNNINKDIMSSSENSTSPSSLSDMQKDLAQSNAKDPDGVEDGGLHAKPQKEKKEKKAAAAKKVSTETSEEKEKIDKVIDYLNKRLGSNYKKDTKVTRSKILKLLRRGFTGKDFADVITNRIKEWSTDSKMKQYLTPATLFAEENFEKYLNLAHMEIPKPLPGNKQITAAELRKLNAMNVEDLTDDELSILIKDGNGLAREEFSSRQQLKRQKV